MTRIITPEDLQGLSLGDLQTLQFSVQQELAKGEPGSQARRNAIASLEALSLAIAQRRALTGPRFKADFTTPIPWLATGSPLEHFSFT